MSEFSGKIYVVAGASSGIGRSVSLELARLGANVVLIARNSAPLEKLLGEMDKGCHTILPFDMARVNDIQGMIEGVYAQYGQLDGCVYCVGTGPWARLRDTLPDMMQEAMLLNCTAFVELVRWIIRKKKKAQGMRIVGISSLASETREKYYAAYAASKAAMEASIRCIATELIAKNATINAVRPGFVATPRLAALEDVTGDVEATIKANGFQPQGLISPEDVARMAVYLLSDAAKSITGACLPVNGGAAC
ncbi:conserved hypothetical protein [uncultured delta proteobacterium]|uniref:Short-chain dehydrogenase/reductase SDR n=1 Tax=uncultured delta proteobacterium TaxID=34034 RepID=A0A212JWG0_9DELT|nr:conserved hypothetical protein [uncultured delta proteobacterium]